MSHRLDDMQVTSPNKCISPIFITISKASERHVVVVELIYPCFTDKLIDVVPPDLD